MTPRLVFGQIPPESVVVVRPERPTACEMPHFTKSGQPKAVPGLVYLAGSESAVLCKSHGVRRFGI